MPNTTYDEERARKCMYFSILGLMRTDESPTTEQVETAYKDNIKKCASDPEKYLRLNNAKKVFLDPNMMADYLNALDNFNITDG